MTKHTRRRRRIVYGRSCPEGTLWLFLFVSSKLQCLNFCCAFVISGIHSDPCCFPCPPPRSSFPSRISSALFGIRGFRAWFESQFPDAMVALSPSLSSSINDNATGGTVTANSRCSTCTAQVFDHVLVDLNQLLHIVVRKSRSDEHALTLLMKELDTIVQHVATPQRSLVLAMDGPPSAAKLATQRQRRFQTVTRSHLKLQQLDRKTMLIKTKRKKSSQSSKLSSRQIRRIAAQTRTLCLTPATAFMQLAHEAILYWSWQRFSARNNILASNNVNIFVSSSCTPGEGEVKLLEWLYQQPNRNGDSVAILGGDSDLVLEALVIPLACTHNVFVLLPDGRQRYLSVSLWETTRRLDQLVQSSHFVAQHRPKGSISLRDMIRIRTDLVLLLLLNGNDYLPKLRGSSGFQRLFTTYLQLQRERPRSFLLHPDSLEFELNHCIWYFGRLAELAPSNLWSPTNNNNNVSEHTNGRNLSTTPLLQLNNLVQMGILPHPVKFSVLMDGIDNDSKQEVAVYNNDNEEGDDFDYVNHDENDQQSSVDDDDDIVGGNDDMILVRMMLGEPDSEDFYAFEVWHPRGARLKSARQKLAAMALRDLIDADTATEDRDEVNEDEVGFTYPSCGYEWEINHSVESKVETYLYGLLWNLQTYQDGVCSDYSYNYGKRLSPTAKKILEFFKAAQREKRKVGPLDLHHKPFAQPVSAGVSCLAALPAPVKHLVPEPYRSISDDTVEAIYALCMSPEDNVFDMQRFERLCNEQLRSLFWSDEACQQNNDNERSDVHYWTVVSKVAHNLAKPFSPPEPFSSQFSKLRPNERIRISRLAALSKPRPRALWTSVNSGMNTAFEQCDDISETHHSDPGIFLKQFGTVEEVNYRIAYQKRIKRGRKGLQKLAVKLTLEPQRSAHGERKNIKDTDVTKDSNRIAAVKNNNQESTTEKVDVELRMREFAIVTPPPEPIKNKDGETAMAILKQLSDAKLIGPVKVSCIKS